MRPYPCHMKQPYRRSSPFYCGQKVVPRRWAENYLEVVRSRGPLSDGAPRLDTVGSVFAVERKIFLRREGSPWRGMSRLERMREATVEADLMAYSSYKRAYLKAVEVWTRKTLTA